MALKKSWTGRLYKDFEVGDVYEHPLGRTILAADKTLEDVAAHYAFFFKIVTGGFIDFTPQDQEDMVAYMKLLD